MFAAERAILTAANAEADCRSRIRLVNRLRGRDDAERAFIRHAKSSAFARLNRARAETRRQLRANWG